MMMLGTYTLWYGGHQLVDISNATLADSTGLLQATFTIDSTLVTQVESCPSLPRKCYACL